MNTNMTPWFRNTLQPEDPMDVIEVCLIQHSHFSFKHGASLYIPAPLLSSIWFPRHPLHFLCESRLTHILDAVCVAKPPQHAPPPALMPSAHFPQSHGTNSRALPKSTAYVNENPIPHSLQATCLGLVPPPLLSQLQTSVKHPQSPLTHTM